MVWMRGCQCSRVLQMADKGKQEVLGVRCPEKAPLAQTCSEGLCGKLGHTDFCASDSAAANGCAP
jgi:hypothetical protein